MNRMKSIWFLVAFVVAFPLLPAQAGEHEEESSSGLEEVVVTAQRREQRLQDVSTSVTALSGELVEDSDIHDLEGIASRTPSLNFAPFSPGQSIVTLRGASSNDDGAGTDNSVALFLDDVYIGRTSNINFEMADLERIEVLRGPQGTLYGKNTIGGAIKVVTRRPSVEEAYGAVNLTTGNYDLRYISGFYSTPVADKWAVKVAASSRVRDGWVTNALLPPGDTSDNRTNQNAQTVRFQALYQGSKTSILMGLDANFLDIDDMARIPIAVNPANLDPTGPTGIGLPGAGDDALVLYLENLAAAGVSATKPNRKYSANPVDGFAKRNAGGFSFKIDHNFNDRDSLAYIFAYRRSVLDWEMDSVGSTRAALNDNIFDKTIQNQHELRANFDRTNWDTTVGLWSSVEATDRTEAFDLIPLGTDSYTQENTTASVATYAHTEVSIGRMFYIGFGGRYTQEAKEITSVSSDDTLAGHEGNADINDIPFIINENFSAKAEEEWFAWTSKITLGLRFNENQHLYLDTSGGFKSGGFAAAPTHPDHLRPLDPETSLNLELGYKGTFGGGVARLNLALFQTNYEDLQIQQFGPPADRSSTFGFFRTINASNATISGIEHELEVRPSVYFYLRHTLTWNHSEYSDGRPLHTGAKFDGKPLLRTPKFKTSLMIGGDVPTKGGHAFRWSIDYRYEGETLHDLTNDNAVSPEHSLLDARLAWLFPQGFELAWWGRNLGDSPWIQHIYTVGFGTIGVYGEPYTTGFTFKYTF